MPVPLVEQAIRSVWAQDHAGPIEVVLWDDGSRDPSLQAAYTAFQESLDRAVTPAGERTLVTFRSEECRGIAYSRNEAVRRARADWLIWLDGDDELPPDAISALLAAVRRSGHPYAVGQCRVVYSTGACQVHRNDRYLATWRRTRRSEADPLANAVFNIHGGLVRRDLFEATGGFNPWFSHAELVEWFRRLLLTLPHPDAFDVLDTVTYVCHKRPGSQSSDRAHVEPQRIDALQRYAAAVGLPPAELDAPMVNVETGCPEYKRVEPDGGSARCQLVDLEPACP